MSLPCSSDRAIEPRGTGVLDLALCAGAEIGRATDNSRTERLVRARSTVGDTLGGERGELGATLTAGTGLLRRAGTSAGRTALGGVGGLNQAGASPIAG